MKSILVDLTGKTLGKIHIIGRADNVLPHNTRWRCRCDICGAEFEAYYSNLSRGSVKCGCQKRKRTLAHERGLLATCKSRAKRNGIPFNLELSDMTIPSKCPVLGIPLHRGVGGFCDNSPTLDRFIPELGYVKGNVEVISFRANRIKCDASMDEVTRVCDWMRKH